VQLAGHLRFHGCVFAEMVPVCSLRIANIKWRRTRDHGMWGHPRLGGSCGVPVLSAKPHACRSTRLRSAVNRAMLMSAGSGSYRQASAETWMPSASSKVLSDAACTSAAKH